MSDFLFIYIILIHYLADFGLQTHEQATKKGEGNDPWNKWLFFHVGVYTFVWFIAVLPFFKWEAFRFAIITFTLHYIVDWLTSRIGKPFWKNQDFHNGFVTVGFDQVLHYLSLWYTFKLFL